MNWTDIKGHGTQQTVLQSALAAQRLHHAYLFTGPEGVGKRTLAMVLANAIHCEKSNGEVCGGCVNCKRIADGNHPDVRIVAPLATKKEISIQQVRDVEKELSFRSFTGKRKIAIIDPATSLNFASQNALLKTLEEPPQDSLLILIAANAGALLPTIRSRCLRLAFGPLPRALVAEHLVATERMVDEEAQLRAAMAMGSIGAAIVFDKQELSEQRRVWIGVLGALHQGDFHGANVAAEVLASNRDEALKFLQWAESWYRDLTVYHVQQNTDEVVNLDMMPELQQQSATGKIAHWLEAFAAAGAASARIQRNLNRRMVMEQFFFHMVGNAG